MSPTARHPQSVYRGRLAPSPTGYLHLGHAKTFWVAQERARRAGGVLVLRNEDVDEPRCRPLFSSAMLEDLRWFGFDWDEGPDRGGEYGPYNQSERRALYLGALDRLRASGDVYPCTCSRRDILEALSAPHEGNDEPIYPGTCRDRHLSLEGDRGPHWRFRVPDGEKITFEDLGMGQCSFTAGVDFGDFIVWRSDGFPAYQLAVVVDDAAMRITEVVRGEDLLKSTARQLLLYRALGLEPPTFHHCPLVCDEQGRRLAKRHQSLSLQSLRQAGALPDTLRAGWQGGVLKRLPRNE